MIDKLTGFFPDAPDPEMARSTLERLVEQESAVHYMAALSGPQRQQLVRLCGFSSFLGNFLIRHPECLPLIGAQVSSLDPSQKDLHTFKYGELLKITCLDLAGAEQTKILRALSDLAIHVIDAAWRQTIPDRALRESQADARLCCIAMGKLGAEELNFSSDVDLIFVYPSEADADAEFAAFHERTVRRIRKFCQTLESNTGQGFLYRVDLRLRPWGTDGPLAMSIDDTERYYEQSADHWERIAWLRSRAVIGNLALGNDLISRLAPFIFRRALGYDDVERLLEIKNEMNKVRERAGRWNIKLGAGGIRDIEFFVHVLQILHGGRHRTLRGHNTLATLVELVKLDLIDGQSAKQLRESYLYLRRLEHRVQMRDERQTHELPADEKTRLVLARSLASDVDTDTVLARFEQQLTEHQDIARGFFERILPQTAEHLQRPVRSAITPRSAAELAWRPEVAAASLERWREVCIKEEWGEVPSNLPLLATVFGASWYFTRFIFFRGAALMEVFDRIAKPEFSVDEIGLRLRRLYASSEYANSLGRLRSAKNQIMLEVLIADLLNELDQEALEAALTNLAESSLRFTSELIFGADTELGMDRLAILGMGRLAGWEMNYGSDLDLILLAPSNAGEEVAATAKDSRRLMQTLSASTEWGQLYDIDVRLRPHGSAGTLVTGLSGMVRYHTGARDIWERQVMLRCRPIQDREGQLRTALREIGEAIFIGRDDRLLKREIRHMRLRVQKELGTPIGKYDIKRGYGGIMDIDFIAHYLQLAHGPELVDLRSASTRQVLRKAKQYGLLARETLDTLLQAYDFLKRIEGRLRLFDVKPVHAMASDSAELTWLARAADIDSAEELINRYRVTTDSVRQRFDEIMV